MQAFLVAGVSHIKDHAVVGSAALRMPVWHINQPAEPARYLRGMFRGITALKAGTLDGHPFVFAASHDGNAYAWNLDQPDDLPTRTFHGNGERLTALTIVGEQLLAAGDGPITHRSERHGATRGPSRLYVWNARTGELETARDLADGNICQLFYEPRTRTCVYTTHDAIVLLNARQHATTTSLPFLHTFAKIARAGLVTTRTSQRLLATVMHSTHLLDWNLSACANHDGDATILPVEHDLPPHALDFATLTLDTAPHLAIVDPRDDIILYNLDTRTITRRITVNTRFYDLEATTIDGTPMLHAATRDEDAIAIDLVTCDVTHYKNADDLDLASTAVVSSLHHQNASPR